MIDRASFPREKVCGDGLSGRSLVSLKLLDAEILEEIKALPSASHSWGVRFVAPNGKNVDIGFNEFEKEEPPGYVIRRRDLDLILVNRVRQQQEISFFENTAISKIIREGSQLRLTGVESGTEFRCKMLMLAAGDASMKFIKSLDQTRQFDPFRPGIGIRTYFTGVEGISNDNMIEIHFLKDLLPWYLWIFPLGNGHANVGMGMLDKSSRSNTSSMKQILYGILEKDQHLAKRFRNAEQMSEVGAARLYYFNKRKKIAGDGYLLLGDAAELIDPFTGEGIGNALMSGILAAKTALTCLEKGDFSIEYTAGYEESVYEKLLKELELGLKLQDMARNAGLINLVVNKARKSKTVRKTLIKMIYNINLKGELANPMFYLRLALNL